MVYLAAAPGVMSLDECNPDLAIFVCGMQWRVSPDAKSFSDLKSLGPFNKGLVRREGWGLSHDANNYYGATPPPQDALPPPRIPLPSFDLHFLFFPAFHISFAAFLHSRRLSLRVANFRSLNSGPPLSAVTDGSSNFYVFDSKLSNKKVRPADAQRELWKR